MAAGSFFFAKVGERNYLDIMHDRAAIAQAKRFVSNSRQTRLLCLSLRGTADN